MSSRTLTIALALVVVLGPGSAAAQTAAAQPGGQAPGDQAGPGPGMGRGGMMGGPRTGPGQVQGMGMGQGSAMRGTMAEIHQLFAAHEKIRRSVVLLPDGVRTTTESDDPRVAALIKHHVARMGARVAAGEDLGIPMETESMRAIIADHAVIDWRKSETTKGVVLTQTSTDKAAVAALQEHAADVSAFAAEGMAAMHRTMRGRMGGMRR